MRVGCGTTAGHGMPCPYASSTDLHLYQFNLSYAPNPGHTRID